MNEETKVQETETVEEPVVKERKRRGGRKPMTPEEKAASAKRREEEKKKADNLRPEVFIQYQELDKSLNEIIEEAKLEFRKEKKRTRITDMKLYVKPEERMAYYVINENSEGKIAL